MLLYSSLARRMPDEFTVFGIGPCTMPRVPVAHTRIEDMARCYVAGVREKQPHGPYLVGGLCAGGVIAYEMAAQLTRAAAPVELVVLLDAAAPRTPRRRRITYRRLSSLTQAMTGSRNQARSTLGQAWFAFGTGARKLLGALASEILWHGEQWWGRARFHLLDRLLARGLPWPRYLTELRALQICEAAWARYLPQPLYGVPVVLVQARRQSTILGDAPCRAIYADDRLGWGPLAQQLDIIGVDGGHATMLREPFVESLAAALVPYLKHQSELGQPDPGVSVSRAGAGQGG